MKIEICPFLKINVHMGDRLIAAIAVLTALQ